jgi:hypothetical protein
LLEKRENREKGTQSEGVEAPEEVEEPAAAAAAVAGDVKEEEKEKEDHQWEREVRALLREASPPPSAPELEALLDPALAAFYADALRHAHVAGQSIHHSIGCESSLTHLSFSLSLSFLSLYIYIMSSSILQSSKEFTFAFFLSLTFHSTFLPHSFFLSFVRPLFSFLFSLLSSFFSHLSSATDPFASTVQNSKSSYAPEGLRLVWTPSRMTQPTSRGPN